MDFHSYFHYHSPLKTPFYQNCCLILFSVLRYVPQMHRKEVQEPRGHSSKDESLEEDLGSNILCEQNHSARGVALAVALPGW